MGPVKDGEKYLQKQRKKVCCQAVWTSVKLKGSVLQRTDFPRTFNLFPLPCSHFEIHLENVCLKS